MYNVLLFNIAMVETQCEQDLIHYIIQYVI